MTCKTNEAVALNTAATKELVQQNDVVTLKADTGDGPTDQIHALMDELGNPGHGIPFLAIFPGGGGNPITLSGPVRQKTVLEALEKAGPSQTPAES
jgi:thiol:disulfide interchange protein